MKQSVHHVIHLKMARIALKCGFVDILFFWRCRTVICLFSLFASRESLFHFCDVMSISTNTRKRSGFWMHLGSVRVYKPPSYCHFSNANIQFFQNMVRISAQYVKRTHSISNHAKWSSRQLYRIFFRLTCNKEIFLSCDWTSNKVASCCY